MAFAEEIKTTILSVIALVIGINLLLTVVVPALSNASSIPIVGAVGTLLVGVAIVMMLLKLV